jgi:hypothetical protein
MKVIVDPSVLGQRSKINANPPSTEQLTLLCEAVDAVLKKRGVRVKTFRFCIDKIDRKKQCIKHPFDCPEGSHPDGVIKSQQIGGYRIRLLADGTPCAGWTMEADKFNIELLVDEAKDIADIVQLYLAGTWPFCDPDGNRRVALGMPREPTNRERRELGLPNLIDSGILHGVD